VVGSISTALIFSFLLQELSYANPDIKSVDLSFGPKFSNELKIPRSIAVVEDTFLADAVRHQNVGGLKQESFKTIYLLQDAHVNESAQKNIAKTLDHILQKEPVKYVFLEAGSGNDSLSVLRKYADLEKRVEVAKSFLKKGYIQGPDYLDLTSEQNFILWGVEDKSLYFKGLEDYRFLKDKREHLNAYLEKVARAVKTLKSKLFNPSLELFDEKREGYLKGDLSLTDYFDALVGEAQKLGLPLDQSFPYLAGLRRVKEKEVGINFSKASEEQIKAFSSLSEADQKELAEANRQENNPFAIDAREHKEAKAFFALLEEKIKNAADYPELFKYFDYLKETEKLNPEKILAEKEKLESLIYASLARSKDEKRLTQVSRAQEVLKRLFNLSLTFEDREALERDPQNFDIVQISGFLNKKIMDLASRYEDALFLDPGYEQAYLKAKEFYDLTRERDKVFIQNILQKMDAEKSDKAVLVAGGYHTEHLKNLLKEKNISYVSIIPQVLQETNMKKYENILLNQKSDLPWIPSLNKEGRSESVSTLSPSFVKEGARGSLDKQWGVLPGAEATVVVDGARLSVKEMLKAELSEVREGILSRPLSSDNKGARLAGQTTVLYDVNGRKGDYWYGAISKEDQDMLVRLSQTPVKRIRAEVFSTAINTSTVRITEAAAWRTKSSDFVQYTVNPEVYEPSGQYWWFSPSKTVRYTVVHAFNQTLGDDRVYIFKEKVTDGVYFLDAPRFGKILKWDTHVELKAEEDKQAFIDLVRILQEKAYGARLGVFTGWFKHDDKSLREGLNRLILWDQQDAVYQPKKLLKFLKRRLGYRREYRFVSESGITIERHTLAVMSNFEMFNAPEMMRQMGREDLLPLTRLALAWHDVGKREEEWSGGSHQTISAEWMQRDLKRLGFTQDQTDFIASLIDQNILGKLLEKGDGYKRRDINRAFLRVTRSARRAHLDLQTYFKILTQYYLSDVSTHFVLMDLYDFLEKDGVRTLQIRPVQKAYYELMRKIDHVGARLAKSTAVLKETGLRLPLQNKLIKTAMVHRTAKSLKILFELAGENKEGLLRRLGNGGDSRLFYDNRPGKPRAGIYLHLKDYASMLVRLKFRKDKGHLWLRVYTADNIFLTEFLYDRKNRKLVHDREFFKQKVLQGDRIPEMTETVPFDRQENNTSHNYFAFKDRGRTFNLTRPISSRYKGSGTDSDLATIYARVAVKKGKVYIYGFLDPDIDHLRNSFARWRFMYDRHTRRYELKNIYFHVPGTPLWFYHLLNGKYDTSNSFYAKLKLDSKGAALIHKDLFLRLGDMFKAEGRSVPEWVLMANSPGEKNRVDIYESGKYDAERGRFDPAGRRFIAAKFYNEKTRLFDRAWQELTRRYEAFMRASVLPAPVVLRVLPSKHEREGHPTRILTAGGKPVNLFTGRFAQRLVLVRFEEFWHRSSMRRGLTLYVLDEEFNPQYVLKRGYLDARKQWVWFSPNKRRPLKPEEKPELYDDILEIGYLNFFVPRESQRIRVMIKKFEASIAAELKSRTLSAIPDKAEPLFEALDKAYHVATAQNLDTGLLDAEYEKLSRFLEPIYKSMRVGQKMRAPERKKSITPFKKDMDVKFRHQKAKIISFGAIDDMLTITLRFYEPVHAEETEQTFNFDAISSKLIPLPAASQGARLAKHQISGSEVQSVLDLRRDSVKKMAMKEIYENPIVGTDLVRALRETQTRYARGNVTPLKAIQFPGGNSARYYYFARDLLLTRNESGFELPSFHHVHLLAMLFFHLEKDYPFERGRASEEYLVKLLSYHGIKNVLEIGPSSRRWAPLFGDALRRAGVSYSIIDQNPYLQEEKVLLEATGIDYREGDARKLDDPKNFGDKKFDLIIMSGVLSEGGLWKPERPGLDAYFEDALVMAQKSIQSLSDNPHAAILATGISTHVLLERDSVEKMADITLWESGLKSNTSYYGEGLTARLEMDDDVPEKLRRLRAEGANAVIVRKRSDAAGARLASEIGPIRQARLNLEEALRLAMPYFEGMKYADLYSLVQHVKKGFWFKGFRRSVFKEVTLLRDSILEAENNSRLLNNYRDADAVVLVDHLNKLRHRLFALQKRKAVQAHFLGKKSDVLQRTLFATFLQMATTNLDEALKILSDAKGSSSNQNPGARLAVDEQLCSQDESLRLFALQTYVRDWERQRGQILSVVRHDPVIGKYILTTHDRNQESPSKYSMVAQPDYYDRLRDAWSGSAKFRAGADIRHFYVMFSMPDGSQREVYFRTAWNNRSEHNIDLDTLVSVPLKAFSIEYVANHIRSRKVDRMTYVSSNANFIPSDELPRLTSGYISTCRIPIRIDQGPVAYLELVQEPERLKPLSDADDQNAQALADQLLTSGVTEVLTKNGDKFTFQLVRQNELIKIKVLIGNKKVGKADFVHSPGEARMDYGFPSADGLDKDTNLLRTEFFAAIEVNDEIRERFRGVGTALFGLATRLEKRLGARSFAVYESTGEAFKFYKKIAAQMNDFIKEVEVAGGYLVYRNKDVFFWDLPTDPLPPIEITPKDGARLVENQVRGKGEEDRGKTKEQQNEVKNATALRKPESVAGINASSQRNLSDNQQIPKGRAVRTDKPTKAGIGFDTVEYSGRQGQEFQEGVFPVSSYIQRLLLRGNHPYSTIQGFRLSNPRSESISFRPLKRNLRYAHWSNPLRSVALSSHLSPLSSNLSFGARLADDQIISRSQTLGLTDFPDLWRIEDSSNTRQWSLIRGRGHDQLVSLNIALDKKGIVRVAMHAMNECKGDVCTDLKNFNIFLWDPETKKLKLSLSNAFEVSNPGKSEEDIPLSQEPFIKFATSINDDGDTALTVFMSEEAYAALENRGFWQSDVWQANQKVLKKSALIWEFKTAGARLADDDQYSRWSSINVGRAQARFRTLEKQEIKARLISGLTARLGGGIRGRTAMDIGAGTGELTGSMASLFERIYAVEKSTASVAELHRRHIPGLVVEKGDFFQLMRSMPKERFLDAVLMSHSLSLYFPLKERDELLNEVLVMIKDGGFLILVLNSNEIKPGNNVEVRTRLMKKHRVIHKGTKTNMEYQLRHWGHSVEVEPFTLVHETGDINEAIEMVAALLPEEDRDVVAIRNYVEQNLKVLGTGKYRLNIDEQILWVSPAMVGGPKKVHQSDPVSVMQAFLIKTVKETSEPVELLRVGNTVVHMRSSGMADVPAHLDQEAAVKYFERVSNAQAKRVTKLVVQPGMGRKGVEIGLEQLLHPKKSYPKGQVDVAIGVYSVDDTVIDGVAVSREDLFEDLMRLQENPGFQVRLGPAIKDGSDKKFGARLAENQVRGKREEDRGKTKALFSHLSPLSSNLSFGARLAIKKLWSALTALTAFGALIDFYSIMAVQAIFQKNPIVDVPIGVIFVLSQYIFTFWMHEMGHYVPAKVFSYKPRILLDKRNYFLPLVATSSVDDVKKDAIMIISGPGINLVLGLMLLVPAIAYESSLHAILAVLNLYVAGNNLTPWDTRRGKSDGQLLLEIWNSRRGRRSKTNDDQAPNPPLGGLGARLAINSDAVAKQLLTDYEAYYSKFKEITGRSESRFKNREWTEVLKDAHERLGSYRETMNHVESQINKQLSSRAKDLRVWESVKKRYLSMIKGRYDRDLALIFFYSVMRRIFAKENISIDYSSDEDLVNFGLPTNFYHTYQKDMSEPIDLLVRNILEDLPFKGLFADFNADVQLVSRKLEAKLNLYGVSRKYEIEFYPNILYRNKGAYLVGRVRTEHEYIGVAIPFLNPENGVHADAVLVGEEEVGRIFSYVRSNFHVETEYHRELASYLKSILPSRPLSDIYSSIGFETLAKIEFRKAFNENLNLPGTKFEFAPGTRGRVMEVLTLNGYFPYVFKIMKDESEKIDPYRQTYDFTIQQYQKVHEKDRVGRMLDAMSFRNLSVPRASFSEELLAHLIEKAPKMVVVQGDVVLLKHVYVQRQVTPLDVYWNAPGRTDRDKTKALVDFGYALKDLAAAGVYTGEFDFKNFGVTSSEQIVLYDFDHVRDLLEMNFRSIPLWPDDDPDQLLNLEDWFTVPDETNWFVPDFIEIETMKHLSPYFIDEFKAVHADLLKDTYWNAMKENHKKGIVADFFPYDDEDRLRPISTPASDNFNIAGARLAGETRILIADMPAGKQKSMDAYKAVAAAFGSDVEVIEEIGLGKNEADLRRLIATYHPAFTIIRSDTVLFGDPEFVKWAANPEFGFAGIIRSGMGTENVSNEATRAENIPLMRSGGSAPPVSYLGVQFLIDGLGAMELPAASTDWSADPEWKDIAGITPEDYKAAVKDSIAGGRGEMNEDEVEALFHATSSEQAISLLKKLEGKRIGLVGFGPVAQAFARRLKDIKAKLKINFEVVATSPSLDAGDPERVAQAELLDVIPMKREELLKTSNILSMHQPGTSEAAVTEKDILENTDLQFIINTARFKSLDLSARRHLWEQGIPLFEDADKARKGKILPEVQQALDEYPKDSKLWHFVNHIGATTGPAKESVERFTVYTLARALEQRLGRPPLTPIEIPEDFKLDIVNGVTIKPISSEAGARLAAKSRDETIFRNFENNRRDLMVFVNRTYVNDWEKWRVPEPQFVSNIETSWALSTNGKPIFNLSRLRHLNKKARDIIWWEAYGTWYENQTVIWINSKYDDPRIHARNFTEKQASGRSAYLEHWLKESHIDVSGKRILVLGTEDGIDAITLKKMGASHVIAIDASEKMIQAARENAKRLGSGIEFIQWRFSDINSLNFQADVVFSNHSVKFLPPVMRERFLFDLSAKLNPNSQMILIEQSHNDFADAKWREDIQKAGFEIDSLKVSDRWGHDDNVVEIFAHKRSVQSKNQGARLGASSSRHVILLEYMLDSLDRQNKFRELAGSPEQDIFKKYFKGRRVLNIGLESKEALDIIGNDLFYLLARLSPERALAALKHLGIKTGLKEENIVTAFADRGIDVVGLDPQIPEDNQDPKYKHGVVEAIPFEDNSFDDIVLVQFFDPFYISQIQFHTGMNIQEFYSKSAFEMARVLRPAGRLYLNVYNPHLSGALIHVGFEPAYHHYGRTVFVNRKPSGARLAETSANTPLTALRASVERAVYEEAPITKEAVITFVAKVYDATRQTGRIALQSRVLEVAMDKDKNVLMIYGFADQPIEIKNFRKAALVSQGAEYEVTLSMSDLQLALNEAYKQTDILKGEELLLISETKVIEEIDLTGFKNEDNDFEAIIGPLLVRELQVAHKDPLGQHTKFLLKGRDAAAVDEVLRQALEYSPEMGSFVYKDEKELLAVHQDYKDARRITVTAVGDKSKPHLIEGNRYFIVQALNRGDIPNLRGIFRVSLFEARLNKNELSDPASSSTQLFLKAYGKLLGREIKSEEIHSFLSAIQGKADMITILLFAVPPIVRLPIKNIIQGARLAMKMAEQAA